MPGKSKPPAKTADKAKPTSAPAKPASPPAKPKDKSPAPAAPTAYSRREIESFREALTARRAALEGDVTALEGQTLKNSLQDAAGNLSSLPSHMADISTDAYEQDMNLNLIEREEEDFRAIDEALAKIEAGTYGLCERCGNKIPKKRLEVIPQTRVCVQCQELLDQNRRPEEAE